MGLSIYATKPGKIDPIRKLALDRSHPISALYKPEVRPCQENFLTNSGTPCPPKQSIYLATCIVPSALPLAQWNHAPFASTPTSGIPLPGFNCSPLGDTCLLVFGPSPQVCETFCDVAGTNCKWYALAPAIRVCTDDVLPPCSANWYSEVASRRCTLD